MSSGTQVDTKLNGTGRRLIKVCAHESTWVCMHTRIHMCTVISNTCHYSVCVATGLSRTTMPKCLFYWAGGMYCKLPWKRGGYTYGHTQTVSQPHWAIQQTQLNCWEWLSMTLLLSHCGFVFNAGIQQQPKWWTVYLSSPHKPDTDM